MRRRHSQPARSEIRTSTPCGPAYGRTRRRVSTGLCQPCLPVLFAGTRRKEDAGPKMQPRHRRPERKNITTLQRITSRKAVSGRMESDCFFFVRRTTAVRFGGSPYPAEAAASGHGVTSRPLDEFCGGTESDGTDTLGILESVSTDRRYRYRTGLPVRNIPENMRLRNRSSAGSQIAEHPSRRRKCPYSTRTGNRTIKQEAVSPKKKRPPAIRNGIRIRLPSIELFSVQPGNRIYPIRSPTQRTRRPPRQT